MANNSSSGYNSSMLLVLLIMCGLTAVQSASKIQSKQGGVGANTIYLCPSFLPSQWIFEDDKGRTYPISHNTGVTASYDLLSINGVIAKHEGLYSCIYEENKEDSMNLTVISVPQFNGCQPAQSCNLGTTLTVSEGQTIPLNISLQFVNGGMRGVRQAIDNIQIRKCSNPSLLYCRGPNYGDKCTKRSSTVGNYSHTIAYNRWELSVDLINTSIADSGVYCAEVDLIHPENTAYISNIKSTLTISVTPTTKGQTVTLAPSRSPSPTATPTPPSPTRPSFCDEKYEYDIHLCSTLVAAIINIGDNSVLLYDWTTIGNRTMRYLTLVEFKTNKSSCLDKYRGSTTKSRVTGIENRPLKKNKIERCQTQCAALVVKMLKPLDQTGCRSFIVAS